MKRLKTNEFIVRAKKVHGNKYDYSKVEYKTSRIKVHIICPKHGDFWQSTGNHLSGQGCPVCGKELGIKNKTDNKERFIQKAKKIHGNRYDYSKVEYKHSHTKVCIICPVHGEFIQQPVAHLQGQGCPICKNVNNSKRFTSNKNEFIKKARKIHGNKYDYSKVEYKRSNQQVSIVCSKHGEFKVTPNNHLSRKVGCPKCSFHVSKSEKELFEFVSSLIPCEQSNRTLIYPQELDIYVPSKSIAIEFNGLFWHSEMNGKDRNYHLNKTNKCNNIGLRLIHIFEDEWLLHQKIVKSRLKHILGKTKYSIYARKCIVKEIDIKTKDRFLSKYHLKGKDNSLVRLGLFHGKRLVAVMTFRKSSFDSVCSYELTRYATISNFNIIGGAGKLLKYFERNHDGESIKTNVDIRWSEGNLCDKLGFEHIANSPPNNHPSRKAGYPIWDCGNMIFQKKNSPKIGATQYLTKQFSTT